MKTDLEYFQQALIEWNKNHKIDSIMPMCPKWLAEILVRTAELKKIDVDKATA